MDLWSLTPKKRLSAARALATQKVDPADPPKLGEVPDKLRSMARSIRRFDGVFSPLNAWMLFVGPSYGREPQGPANRAFHNLYAGKQYPTLGRPHPNSGVGVGPTHDPIREWPIEGYKRAGTRLSPLDTWSLAGFMNMSEVFAGDGTKVNDDDLIGGLPKLRHVVDVVRPRVVVALMGRVFDVIRADFSQRGLVCSSIERGAVPGKTNKQMYRPRYCWVRATDDWAFVLGSAPNHPSRMSFLDRESTFDYLADLVRTGLKPAPV